MSQTKRMCRIAIMAALLFVCFESFSNILYLEVITLMLVSLSVVFDLKDALASAFIFGFLLIVLKGASIWNIMYIIIYPTYSLLSSLLAEKLLKHSTLAIIYGFLLSLSVGMILDLPFILVSKTVTIYYILSGLKTSLIQGCLTACEFTFLFEPLTNVLRKIKEKN